MGYLKGLQEYMDSNYSLSFFDPAAKSGQSFLFHLHGHRIMQARILENLVYDLRCETERKMEETIPKVHVKMLYSLGLSERVQPLLKTDNHVKGLGLEPIFSPRKRYFVKNKSLFPLMQQKEVLLFTLLEGEVLKGIVADFNRYEITLHLKGGLPVTLMRHSLYDVRNKKGRCFMKSRQEELKDWEKSPLFVSETEANPLL